MIIEEEKLSENVTEELEQKTCEEEIKKPPELQTQNLKEPVLKKPKVPAYVPKDRPGLNEEEMYVVAKAFSQRVFSLPEVYNKLKLSKLKVRMKYFDDERWQTEPEITIDCSGEEVQLYLGPCEIKPDVIMYMHADVAHRFWMQKLNLMAAVIKGEIKAFGPINKAMKLLPTLKPSFEIYKQILKDLGLEKLIQYPT